MKRRNEGVWLRGNLHMHTSRSDGRLSYEAALALYERAGYDFIAVTDHWILSEAGSTPGGMMLLPGCEYNVGATVQEGVYHIVGVGMEREPALSRFDTALNVQGLIDAIRAAGGLAILAHPAWSLNSAEEVRRLHGLCGTEIYNTTSGFPMNARPYSGLFVDQLASLGMLLPCMAADDAHQYGQDVLGGWLMVHARERSPQAVMEALTAGDFYATQGPSISMTIHAGVAQVTCSPAERIVFYSDAIWSPERVCTGRNVTQAVYHLQPHETFLRAEVIDSDGRCAYTSPVRCR